ncbi:hypothetical protein AMAG_08006 [Allomyces macrogynus ATCC 38327]|uniref:Uncharacterized protein n=1 Tax=Allomyces macrogynus (strain ATCC 38327) TaxID=578462 RepID=A0A0L0SK83_ALLM3|nr:hypothetical protein AMAG_08006 [Allomyces macrogynus ATCC 38327]|eukprot:KNE62829.1 hypothetical protein AMAG_08006 [Allomyces macrogynus ATCC 38327]
MASSNFPRMAWPPPLLQSGPPQTTSAPVATGTDHLAAANGPSFASLLPPAPVSTTNAPGPSVPSYDPAIPVSIHTPVSHVCPSLGAAWAPPSAQPAMMTAAAPFWAGPATVLAAAAPTHGPGALAAPGVLAASATPMLSTGGVMPNGYGLAAPMHGSVPATSTPMSVLNSVLTAPAPMAMLNGIPAAAPPTPQLAPAAAAQDGPEYTVVFTLSAPTTHAPGTAYPVAIDAPAVHVRDPATGHGTTLSLPDTIHHAAAAAFPIPIQLLLQTLTGMPAALAETLRGVGCAPAMAGAGDSLGAFTAPPPPIAVPTPAAAAPAAAPATWTPVATLAAVPAPSVVALPLESALVFSADVAVPLARPEEVTLPDELQVDLLDQETRPPFTTG